MNETKIRNTIEELIENEKYIGVKYKEEILDEIVSDIISTINFYSKPLEECVRLIKENKFETKIIGEVNKYMTEECLFFDEKIPVLCWDTKDIVEFLEQFDTNYYKTVIYKIPSIIEDWNDARGHENPVWIFSDGGDIHIKNESDFVDGYIIEALEEVGDIEGWEKHLINILEIIEKNLR